MMNLKLVITDRKLSVITYWKLVDDMNGHDVPTLYEGESFNVLRERLLEFNVSDKNVYISADERPLLLIPEVFEIDNVYIYRNGAVKPIRECTTRQLKNGHDIFKLYLAGEFEF